MRIKSAVVNLPQTGGKSRNLDPRVLAIIVVTIVLIMIILIMLLLIIVIITAVLLLAPASLSSVIIQRSFIPPGFQSSSLVCNGPSLWLSEGLSLVCKDPSSELASSCVNRPEAERTSAHVLYGHFYYNFTPFSLPSDPGASQPQDSI